MVLGGWGAEGALDSVQVFDHENDDAGDADDGGAGGYGGDGDEKFYIELQNHTFQWTNCTFL